MAKKISQLTAAVAAATTDIIPIVDVGGTTLKATLAQVQTALANFGAEDIQTTGNVFAASAGNPAATFSVGSVGPGGSRSNVVDISPANNLNVGAPVLGSTVVNSPWSGMNGQTAPINMGGINYTLSPAEYANTSIFIGGPPAGGALTLFLPNATNAQFYAKFIRHMNGGGFPLTVQDVAAGNTVTIADGFGAWVGVDAAGAFRMGPDV